MDDIRAIMDAVGSERAALLGYSEGAAMSALFAATYPERTPALVLYGTFLSSEWLSWSGTHRQLTADEQLDEVAARWGTPEYCDELNVRNARFYVHRSRRAAVAASRSSRCGICKVGPAPLANLPSWTRAAGRLGLLATVPRGGRSR